MSITPEQRQAAFEKQMAAIDDNHRSVEISLGEIRVSMSSSDVTGNGMKAYIIDRLKNFKEEDIINVSISPFLQYP